MARKLQLSLLGSPKIYIDEVPVVGFISAKSQALFFYLAVTRRMHSRQALATLLWSEMQEVDARANLRVTLSNLRQLLGEYLTITRETVTFNYASQYWMDFELFQDRQRNNSDADKRVAVLGATIDLYRGDFLEGFHIRDTPVFEEWVLVQREQLRQAALEGLHVLATHALEQGRFADGIPYVTRLLALEPWQEDAHRQLMLLLALNGQRNAALSHYEICRRLLARDLGVEPSQETVALYERIRATELDGISPVLGPDAEIAFVGRAVEHAWLIGRYEVARRGGAQFTLIEGESGIGKTRLIEEVLRYVESQGACVLRGHCYEFEHEVPYQPIVEVLRAALRIISAGTALSAAWLDELARLLPELRMNGSSRGASESSGETTRQRMFEAAARLLHRMSGSENQRRRLVVVFLDDLQWVDQGTADLLRYLFERLHDSLIWFVCACRSDELPLSHPVLLLRRTFGRSERLALLRIESLGDAAILDLARKLPQVEESAVVPLAEYLARESEGNPFIIRQVFQDCVQRGLIVRTTGNVIVDLAFETAEIPFGVREMILGRLSRLSAIARRLLGIAAVVGRNFEPELLQIIMGQSVDVAEYLDECLARQILVFQSANVGKGTGMYRFSHVMIQRVAVEGLSPWHCAQIHGRVAAALEVLYQGRLDQIADRLAFHAVQSVERAGSAK